MVPAHPGLVGHGDLRQALPPLAQPIAVSPQNEWAHRLLALVLQHRRERQGCPAGSTRRLPDSRPIRSRLSTCWRSARPTAAQEDRGPGDGEHLAGPPSRTRPRPIKPLGCRRHDQERRDDGRAIPARISPAGSQRRRTSRRRSPRSSRSSAGATRLAKCSWPPEGRRDGPLDPQVAGSPGPASGRPRGIGHRQGHYSPPGCSRARVRGSGNRRWLSSPRSSPWLAVT